MKRKYFFTLGVVLLLLITSCGPRRYGCNRRRCITQMPTELKINNDYNKKAANGSFFIYISNTA